MAVSLASLQTAVVGVDGGALLAVVFPYLPALAREGEVVYSQFVQHCLDKEWDKLDALMYEKMTPQERTDLDTEVLFNMRQACIDQVERITITENLLLKLALSVASALVTGALQSAMSPAAKP